MRNFASRTKSAVAEPTDGQAAMNGTPAAPRETPSGEPLPSRYIVFAVVSMGLFMSSIDATIVATALRSINTGLHAGINWGAWTITAYSLGRVTGLPSMGKVGEQYGRRKVFLVSIGVFTVASLACGLSTSIYMLVPLRFIQAVGGSAFMPSATGIVSDQFGRSRDRAVGMFSSILPIGGVIGPILGGLFVTYWSWRGIFLVNVPIGLLLIALTFRFVPVTPPRAAQRMDVLGITLLTTLLLAAMYGITSLGEGRTQVWDPRFLLPVLASAGLCVLFVRHIKRADAPVVPIELLKGKGFGAVNTINILFGASALGFGALVPLYAQNRYKIASLASGTLLTARALGMVAIAGLATMALRRTGYRRPMILGFLIAAGGTVVMASTPISLSPYAWIALGAGITGFGMGCVMPAAANAGMQLDPRYVGAIAGLRGTFRNIGSIMSISVTTAIIARSRDPGIAQGHVFIAFAIVLVALTPLVLLVPDHRGSW